MTEFVDPNDFIITRKRKKYRFARFQNAPNCFELDMWQKRPIDVVEVGAGNGFFCLELAEKHPDQTFLALDVKGDRLQQGAYRAIERGITNVFFVRARADQIDQLCDAASLSMIWLTFPDPFPRQRSAHRRLTHPGFLARYQQMLQKGGSLCLKHDNDVFFQWSLEQLVLSHWRLEELSFDLHSSSLLDDYKVLTSYEQRWLADGLTTKFVRARHNDN